MDKFCEDCVHNEVCQYYATPPHIDRCNDKDTLDDLIPQGEWVCHSDNYITFYTCNRCNGFGYKDDKFCNNCGAKMGGDAE